MNFRKLVTLGMTLSVLGANITAPAVYPERRESAHTAS